MLWKSYHKIYTCLYLFSPSKAKWDMLNAWCIEWIQGANEMIHLVKKDSVTHSNMTKELSNSWQEMHLHTTSSPTIRRSTRFMLSTGWIRCSLRRCKHQHRRKAMERPLTHNVHAYNCAWSSSLTYMAELFDFQPIWVQPQSETETGLYTTVGCQNAIFSPDCWRKQTENLSWW